MKIKDVLKLEKGDPFKVEGKVFYTKTPKEINGPKGIFYSQFLMMKDDSCGEDEKLAAEITFNNESEFIENDMDIVIKGQVSEYNGNLYYRGKVIERIINQEQEKVDKVMKTISNNYSNNSKNTYWENKFEWEKEVWKFNRAGMSRSNGVQFAVNFMKMLVGNKVIELAGAEEAEIMLWKYIKDLGRYIYEGKKPTDLEIVNKPEDTDNNRVKGEGNADFPFGEAKENKKKAVKKVTSKG